MKQLFFWIVCATIFMTIQPIYSYDFSSNGIYYNITSTTKKTVSVTSGDNAYTGNMVIPSSVKYGGVTYTVSSIGTKAFAYPSDLNTLVIPNSVEEVDGGAFQSMPYGTPGLKNLIIEDGNTPISIKPLITTTGGYAGFLSGCKLDSLYIGRDIAGKAGSSLQWVNYQYKDTQGSNKIYTLATYGGPFEAMSLNHVEIASHVKVIPYYSFRSVINGSSIIIRSEAVNFIRSEAVNFVTLPFKSICVPPTTVEKYKEQKYEYKTVIDYQNPQSNTSNVCPIADLMFFNTQTPESYLAHIANIDKSSIKSVGFYPTELEGDWNEKILKEGFSPNCLFYISSEVSIEWSNVVNLGTATTESLTIEDGYPFAPLVPFLARKASYTHNPTVWADGQKGWETIILPFTPDYVEASTNGYISPVMLGSAGNYWLRQYVGCSNDAVYFASTSDGVMHANTPYLIAFPGDKIGKGSLEGQTITFQAQDALVAMTESTEVQKNNYTFAGNYDLTASAGWELNAEGSSFVWKESVGNKPFSAYFKSSASDAMNAPYLRMDFDDKNTTGLEQIISDLEDPIPSRIYTLDGHHIISKKNLNPGLYIINNKKVMIR